MRVRTKRKRTRRRRPHGPKHAFTFGRPPPSPMRARFRTHSFSFPPAPSSIFSCHRSHTHTHTHVLNATEPTTLNRICVTPSSHRPNNTVLPSPPPILSKRKYRTHPITGRTYGDRHKGPADSCTTGGGSRIFLSQDVSKRFRKRSGLGDFESSE